MYSMVLKVYTCQEAASGPKTFLNIFCNFCNKMNLPQPDSGPDSNINSPYCLGPFFAQKVVFVRVFNSVQLS
jgi:hypothetical protein